MADSRYSVQRLGANDLKLCRQLLEVFRVAFEDDAPPDPATDEHLEAILAVDTNFVLVARQPDGSVCGGLVAYLLRKLQRRQSEVFLYDLAVAEPFRRLGIASTLIQRLSEIGEAAGAGVIFVQAENVDAPAVALYTKLCSSLETDITHFDIEFGGEPGAG